MADSSHQTPNHVHVNRKSWDAAADDYQRTHGPQLNVDPMKWGVWGLPEARLRVLDEVAGKRVLELGCGGAQWSIALAASGAEAVGLDLSLVQLTHARRLQAPSGRRVALVAADGGRIPFKDSTFDIVFCDYGAMTFADPLRTVPEVARVLRRGGQFAFLTTSPFFVLCTPDGAEHPGPVLAGEYFGMHELHYVEDEGEPSVEFQLPYGEWIGLFRAEGFTVEALIEPRPSEEAVSSYRTDEDREWARRWPMECIWKLRRE